MFPGEEKLSLLRRPWPSRYDGEIDVKKPTASILSVQLDGVSGDNITYVANVVVFNPYPVPIPICSFDYILRTVDSVSVWGGVPDQEPLMGSDARFFEVEIEVPVSAFADLRLMLSDTKCDWAVVYRLEMGLVVEIPEVGKVTIPISRSGDIDLPKIGDMK